jgi:hypothetical protein
MGRLAGSWARWGVLGRRIRGFRTAETNSPTVSERFLYMLFASEPATMILPSGATIARLQGVEPDDPY